MKQLLEFFKDGNHFNIFEESQRDLGKKGEDYLGFKMLIIFVVLCLICTIAKKHN